MNGNIQRLLPLDALFQRREELQGPIYFSLSRRQRKG